MRRNKIRKNPERIGSDWLSYGVCKAHSDSMRSSDTTA
jgi:hypothetical protein